MHFFSLTFPSKEMIEVQMSSKSLFMRSVLCLGLGIRVNYFVVSPSFSSDLRFLASQTHHPLQLGSHGNFVSRGRVGYTGTMQIVK